MAFGLAAFSGCSVSTGGSDLDTTKLEREIAKGIREQLSIDAVVDCPGNVKITAGDTFTCTAKAADGTTAEVNVTQNDDKGNVSWRLGQGGSSTSTTGTAPAPATTPATDTAPSASTAPKGTTTSP